MTDLVGGDDRIAATAPPRYFATVNALNEMCATELMGVADPRRTMFSGTFASPAESRSSHQVMVVAFA